MRIVFIDLQCINFLVRTYRQIKDGNKIATYKHKFIIDYAIKNNIEICNYITMNKSSRKGFKYYKKLPIGKKMVLSEFKYVIENSYEEMLPIVLIMDKNEIREDDLVVGYLYDRSQLAVLKELGGIKILMGNHFVAINEPINLDDYGVRAFVNEINLKNNSFVNKYIHGHNIAYLTAPYIYADRFVNHNRDRKNKAMAIGTLSTCAGHSGYKLYREFTGTEWIQPLRKMIFDNKDILTEEIDSYISYIFEDKIVINDDENICVKLYKKMQNKRIGWVQNNYTSFNMVDKFNEYKMFLCPEEEIGMPGIGFVEGMACGTAYIGLDAQFYRDLGLYPGRHFITYDGTLEHLKEVIHYYQLHNDELERIATLGTNFVRSHFSAELVAKSLFNDFKRLVSEE